VNNLGAGTEFSSCTSKFSVLHLHCTAYIKGACVCFNVIIYYCSSPCVLYDGDSKMLFAALKVVADCPSPLVTPHLLFFRVKVPYLSLSVMEPLCLVSSSHVRIMLICTYIGQQAYRGPYQTKGLSMVPKKMMNVMSCEIVRLLQLTQNSIIPISYQVPKKVSVKCCTPFK
jgi:hypothetical protein